VSAHLSIVLLLKQPARVLSRVIRVHFFQLQMQQKILRKPKNRAIHYLSIINSDNYDQKFKYPTARKCDGLPDFQAQDGKSLYVD
jgi:hypothetical protein